MSKKEKKKQGKKMSAEEWVSSQKEKAVKSKFAGVLVKSIVFSTLSLAMVFGTFFLEQRLASGDEVIVTEFSDINTEGETEIYDYGLIRFDDALEGDMDIVSQIENEYIFDLKKGRIWGNFWVSNAKVNILVGKVMVIPNHAVFDLSYDGDDLSLAVYEGDVYIGFLSDELQISEYRDEYSDLFSNRLLVARDSQVEIPMSKVDQRVVSLLHSKLIKEFKYAAIPGSSREDEFVTANISSDLKYVEELRQEIKSKIIFEGVQIKDSVLSSLFAWMEENLTFVPADKEELLFERLFAYLQDATFYMKEGDQTKSDQLFSEFSGYFAALPEGIKKGERYRKEVQRYIDQLAVFGIDDDLNDLYKKLLTTQAELDKYALISDSWMDVYRAMDVGESRAQEALTNFYTKFDLTLKQESDLTFYRGYITYYNQLFDNLFLRYSYFYRDGFFAMKSVIEDELLAVYESGRDREELVQDLINNKIKFVKRMRNFFFEGQIEVEEAKDIISRLVEEIEDLMPGGEESKVAILELFESELRDIENLWGYLNRPDFYSSKSYGLTHKERYESYLSEKDTLNTIDDLRSDILGEESVETTVDQVVDFIQARFAENEDYSSIKLGEIEDVKQRKIPIEGVVGGYNFEAIYDRDKDLLEEVYVYEEDEPIADFPVQVEKLRSVLIEKYADLAGPPPQDGDGDVTVESVNIRTARVFITEKIQEAGFTVELEQVTVVDELNGVYRVEGVYVGEDETTKATFDYLTSGEVATNLFLSIDLRPVVLDGKFTLEELKSVMIAEEDFTGALPDEDQGEDDGKVSR